jgi:hypothetical protein
MTKSSKTILTLALTIFTVLFFNSAFAEAVKSESNQKASSKNKPSKFYIQDGKQLELCRDIKKILDDPENINFGEPFMQNAEFAIPKSYKDFRAVKWEDVPEKDVTKYIASPKILEIFSGFKERNKNTGKFFVFKKTNVDFDNDGSKEVILSHSPSDMLGFSSCHVSDIPETVVSQTYNTMYASQCYLFYYKGRIYSASASNIKSIAIDEPQTSRAKQKTFFPEPVCRLVLTPAAYKISSKALDEEVAKTAPKNLRTPEPEKQKSE